MYSLKQFRSKEFIYYSTPYLILVIIFYYIYVTSLQYRNLALRIFNNTHVVLKSAVENPDGTIDVVLNVPGPSERFAELLRRGHLSHPDTGCRDEHSKKKLKRTHYPLTIDSPYVLNNPNVCTNVENLKFIIIVHSATENFQRRRIIRETWANKNIFKTINLRIVFLFGLTKVKKTQELIENESVVYGDIVQGNFLDTYHNLTHKGVLAFRWIHDFCQEAEMVVKIDDDLFLNVFVLLERFYPKFKTKKRYILCHFRKKGTSPIVRGVSKWHVEENEFRGYSHYPTNYCNGYLVLISRDIIRPLYRASYLTPFFWVDDVYLYGLLPDKIGHVHHEDIRSNMTLNLNLGLKCFTEKKNCSYLAVNAGGKESAVENMWYAVLSQISPTMRKEVNPILLF